MADLNPATISLLRLASPALPVGGFAYSQGLEHAVEAGWLKSRDQVSEWLIGVLDEVHTYLDVPVFKRLYQAWESDGPVSDGVVINLQPDNGVYTWSETLSAWRDASELRLEDRNQGQALARLLADTGVEEARPWIAHRHCCFATTFSLAALRWRVELEHAVAAYLWAWAENQVAAAIKLVPLGQTDGQRILAQLVERIPTAVEIGLALPDEEIGASAPALAMGSALHEVQYSRMFRS